MDEVHLLFVRDVEICGTYLHSVFSNPSRVVWNSRTEDRRQNGPIHACRSSNKNKILKNYYTAKRKICLKMYLGVPNANDFLDISSCFAITCTTVRQMGNNLEWVIVWNLNSSKSKLSSKPEKASPSLPLDVSPTSTDAV